MTKPSYKEIITEAVLKELPSSLSNMTKDEALKLWWKTGARSEGLRLSESGDMAFRVAEIEFYQYDFSIRAIENFHSYILELNRKLKCPYFLGTIKEDGKKHKPFIRLYDSKIAVMVSLYGDLESYIKSVKVR